MRNNFFLYLRTNYALLEHFPEISTAGTDLVDNWSIPTKLFWKTCEL